jgi:hypothetical protein
MTGADAAHPVALPSVDPGSSGLNVAGLLQEQGDSDGTSAWFDVTVDGGDDTTNPSATISHTQLIASGPNSAAPTDQRPRRCEVREVPIQQLSPERAVRDQLSTVDAMVAGTTYYLECAYLDDNQVFYADLFEYQPGQSGPDLAAIARQVYDEVPLVFPNPSTSPPADADQLVGFPTWLWIDPAAFQTFDARATLAGITVTVTAEPMAVMWTMGDGATVTCDGPGTPWNPDGGDGQTTDCSHVYQHVSADQADGRYPVSATVTWAVTWDSTTGEGGTLADASRTTTFDLGVTERQAVVSYGSG